MCETAERRTVPPPSDNDPHDGRATSHRLDYRYRHDQDACRHLVSDDPRAREWRVFVLRGDQGWQEILPTHGESFEGDGWSKSEASWVVFDPCHLAIWTPTDTEIDRTPGCPHDSLPPLPVGE